MELNEKYSTAHLEAIVSGAVKSFPGDYNSAPYLLKLDTVERRLRAVGEAHTLCNLLSFRYSQAVADAVSALLDNIAAGQEEKLMYGEATAKRYRDSEAERRKATRGY